MAFSVLAVGATNVLLWVRVAPIAVLMVFAWAAPGLRDEWSFLFPRRSNMRARHE